MSVPGRPDPTGARPSYRGHPPHRVPVLRRRDQLLRPRLPDAARLAAPALPRRTELHIDPEPADSSTSRDAYGNISSYFHVTERHRTLTVTSDSVVEVDPPPAGPVRAAAPAAAPWEIARPVGPDGALAIEFTLDLQPPEITDEVRDYAAPSFDAGPAR